MDSPTQQNANIQVATGASSAAPNTVISMNGNKFPGKTIQIYNNFSLTDVAQRCYGHDFSTGQTVFTGSQSAMKNNSTSYILDPTGL